MSDRPWKQEERMAAAIFGGRRFTANQGGALDFESEGFVGSVKHLKRIPRWLEHEALEMERIGFQKLKIGVVVLKRRAHKPTPRLIVLTEGAWRELNGPIAEGP